MKRPPRMQQPASTISITPVIRSKVLDFAALWQSADREDNAYGVWCCSMKWHASASRSNIRTIGASEGQAGEP